MSVVNFFLRKILKGGEGAGGGDQDFSTEEPDQALASWPIFAENLLIKKKLDQGERSLHKKK